MSGRTRRRQSNRATTDSVQKQPEITYRKAEMSDLNAIQSFVDFWLSGRAKNKGIAGGGNDYFVTRNQHRCYLKSCHVLLAERGRHIVGWGVKGQNNVLIHLLIDARERGKGIGQEMLKRLNPDIIRSKSDQITGDPAPFYEKHGYVIVGSRKIGKNTNIDLMVKGKKGSVQPGEGGASPTVALKEK